MSNPDARRFGSFDWNFRACTGSDYQHAGLGPTIDQVHAVRLAAISTGPGTGAACSCGSINTGVFGQVDDGSGTQLVTVNTGYRITLNGVNYNAGDSVTLPSQLVARYLIDMLVCV